MDVRELIFTTDGISGDVLLRIGSPSLNHSSVRFDLTPGQVEELQRKATVALNDVYENAVIKAAMDLDSSVLSITAVVDTAADALADAGVKEVSRPLLEQYAQQHI